MEKEYLPSSDHRKNQDNTGIMSDHTGMFSATIDSAPVSIHITVLSRSKGGKREGVSIHMANPRVVSCVSKKIINCRNES